MIPELPLERKWAHPAPAFLMATGGRRHLAFERRSRPNSATLAAPHANGRLGGGAPCWARSLAAAGETALAPWRRQAAAS
eukprot:11190409-Lingulodinium_polyedra.AAC.1